MSIALREFPSIAIRYVMDAMKVIQEIRLENLKTLQRECGSVVKLAERLKRSQGQVSQLLNESVDKKTGKRKQIGDAQARHIESSFGKERGWMDNDHSSLAAQLAVVLAANREQLKGTDEYVENNMPDFVAPNSPLRLRVRRETIIRAVDEPGDQRDLFRDAASKKK